MQRLLSSHTMKHELFNGTAIENLTMDSFIKRIMLSAVYISGKEDIHTR